MKQHSFPQQTHFIGVLLPEDITLTLEDCRRYMNRAYGCKSGHGTPIHVTLVPPFRLQKDYSTYDLINAGQVVFFEGAVEKFQENLRK